MSDTTDGIQPPYATSSGEPQGGAYIFVIGFFCVVVLLISLTYTSYLCKRPRPPPPPPPSITFNTATYDDADSHRRIRFSHGLDDDVLVTFPTFLYSGEKGDAYSSCSICLSEYKQADELRLLPECGHLFHVGCVDTWLKAHPTCPICRNKQIPEPDGFTSSAELTE